MAASSAVHHHRARVGALARAVRNGERPQSDLDDAKRALAEANIADYVRKVVAAAPPLTDEQRTRLAELLAPARAHLTAGGA